MSTRTANPESGPPLHLVVAGTAIALIIALILGAASSVPPAGF